MFFSICNGIFYRGKVIIFSTVFNKGTIQNSFLLNGNAFFKTENQDLILYSPTPL